MRPPRPLLRVYHGVLRLVLHAVGLDFSWYENFYRRWPHALPPLEAALQRLRPRARSRTFFRHYVLERFARPGDIVLDVGANIGEVSSHLLRLGYVVHAYEADPRCVEFLRRRFSRIDPARFHLHAEAVSDFDGTAPWHRGTRTSESNTLLDGKPGTDAKVSGEVPVRSMTGVLDAVGHAALILMDIEGAEYPVIQQLLEPANRGRFGLCIAEAHASKMPSLAAEHERLLATIKRAGADDRVLLDWH